MHFNLDIATGVEEGKLNSKTFNSEKSFILCHLMLVQKGWVNTYNIGDSLTFWHKVNGTESEVPLILINCEYSLNST